MVGEIYVRLNDFANDYIIKKLNTMQIEVYLSPFQSGSIIQIILINMKVR